MRVGPPHPQAREACEYWKVTSDDTAWFLPLCPQLGESVPSILFQVLSFRRGVSDSKAVGTIFRRKQMTPGWPKCCWPQRNGGRWKVETHLSSSPYAASMDATSGDIAYHASAEPQRAAGQGPQHACSQRACKSS